MKKISKASFIIAVVLIVFAIALNVLGFIYINGVRYVRHFNGGFMQMSYTTTSSMANTCLGMIIAGGFLFIGGILLFMLSAMTCHRPPKAPFCFKDKQLPFPKEEVKAEAKAAEPEPAKPEEPKQPVEPETQNEAPAEEDPQQ